jgi:hypothetical protein
MTSSSQESEADQRPAYQYTTKGNMLTWLNGGWSREGNDKYVELYDRVKQDRLIDNGVFKESTWRTGLRREQNEEAQAKWHRSNGVQGEDRDDVGVLHCPDAW